MTEPTGNQNSSGAENAADAEQLPGDEFSSQQFLSNLRSSYTPSQGPSYYGQRPGSKSLQTSFQIPNSLPRLGMSSSFRFDETSATTAGGERINKRETDIKDSSLSSHSQPEKLITGDTIRRSLDQEILVMKNDYKLIIYKSLGWIMEDADGNAITRVENRDNVEGGSHSEFALSKSGEEIGHCVENNGISTITFNDGDKVIFDLSGIASVARQLEAAYIREPIRKIGSYNGQRVFFKAV
ncbi:MAG: hypothetical protein IAF58_00290 [Leptolyngbya sp.]|nr:hypothetical protein [Candidatus Melainabacteria bacterium]